MKKRIYLSLTMICLLASCTIKTGTYNTEHSDYKSDDTQSTTYKTDTDSSDEDATDSFVSDSETISEVESDEPLSNSETSESISESSEPEPTYTVYKTLSDSKVYLGSLTNSISLPCTFFTFDEDVPYVTLKDYFINFWDNTFGEFFTIVGGNKVKNGNTNARLVFNTDKNQITSTDYDQFVNYTGYSVPFDIFSTDYDSLSDFDESNSTYTKGKELVINLDDYNTKIIKYSDEIYVPFSYLNTIVLSDMGYNFAFNGSDFYYVNYDAITNGDTLTDYGKAFYSGSLSKTTSRSTSYINYFYNSFLFTLENFNGKYEDLELTSTLDAKLEELGLKEKLMSTDSATADAAVCETLYQVFADGGHTYFEHRGLTCEYSSSTDKDLSYQILDYDDRYYKEAETYATLYQKRGTLTKNLEISGSTAIIRFDSFNLNSSGSTPTKDNVSSDTQSTFAIFYNSFKEIEKNSNIKNVVFDVSLNGGGYTMALAHALSFITDDPIKANLKNPLTGATYTVAANYDNDFDGDTSDKDSYQGKYNFYILTSGYSFSCANAFPCIAKENGYAKIIGETSGGGDCAVSSAIAVDGTSWNMSGNEKLIHADGSTFDEGTSVDYKLSYDYYYDIDKLNTYLSTLA